MDARERVEAAGGAVGLVVVVVVELDEERDRVARTLSLEILEAVVSL